MFDAAALPHLDIYRDELPRPMLVPEFVTREQVRGNVASLSGVDGSLSNPAR